MKKIVNGIEVDCSTSDILQQKIDSDNHIENIKINIRKKRDELLSETDWMIVKNLEVTSSISDEWKNYRQELRDLPENPNFPNVEFPKPPENNI